MHSAKEKEIFHSWYDRKNWSPPRRIL